MSKDQIDYASYRLLDDVAYDHAVGDKLYDDFSAWKRANGKSDAMDLGEQLQAEFLAQYHPT
jgi:hypothetical protein